MEKNNFFLVLTKVVYDVIKLDQQLSP